MLLPQWALIPVQHQQAIRKARVRHALFLQAVVTARDTSTPSIR